LRSHQIRPVGVGNSTVVSIRVLLELVLGRAVVDGIGKLF
jgi:hypothetical protein